MRLVQSSITKNVKSKQIRAENINAKFDFVISRAVSKFSTFCPWVKNKLKENNKHKLKNGILYLKGGDLLMKSKKLKMIIVLSVIIYMNISNLISFSQNKLFTS